MIEWDATGVIIGSLPFGESDLIATALTEAHGACRGLVRGGRGQRQRGRWDVGNVVSLRWRGRLVDQLGAFSGEPIASPHATLADAPLDLATMAAACAVAREALTERLPCHATFTGLLLLLARLMERETALPTMIRWEIDLLAELGFGLDLSRCARTGTTGSLTYVSPRTGRAVSADAAAEWRDKLLPLPGFVLQPGNDDESGSEDWVAGLALTGHFLERDVFHARHKEVPAARQRLVEIVGRFSGP